jgi:transcriptional regulator with XRE-family HTH domain
MSLRGAAKELQVDASYLSRVERGDKSASSGVLDSAAAYYELPREQLELAAGALPPDVAEILRAHPEIIDQLRKTLEPAEQAIYLGVTLGSRYRVDAHIGDGNFSGVFRAHRRANRPGGRGQDPDNPEHPFARSTS